VVGTEQISLFVHFQKGFIFVATPMRAVCTLHAFVRPRFVRQYSLIARVARENVEATLSSSALQSEIEAEDWLLDGCVPSRSPL
jgi:hypothetical protein